MSLLSSLPSTRAVQGRKGAVAQERSSGVTLRPGRIMDGAVHPVQEQIRKIETDFMSSHIRHPPLLSPLSAGHPKACGGAARLRASAEGESPLCQSQDLLQPPNPFIQSIIHPAMPSGCIPCNLLWHRFFLQPNCPEPCKEASLRNEDLLKISLFLTPTKDSPMVPSLHLLSFQERREKGT